MEIKSGAAFGGRFEILEWGKGAAAVYTLGIIFSWTWWIWCPAFIFCLVSAIRRSVQQAMTGEEKLALHFTCLAALFFAVIVGGLAAMIVIY